MKKFFTFAFCLIAGTIGMMAQENAIFVDAATGGNEVADGSVITVNELDGDQISSGLYVSNTTSDPIYVSVEYDIQTLPNGTSQICFPMNCVSQTKVGTYETQYGTMSANETKSLQAEWMPEAYGTSTVVYTIKYYKKDGAFPSYTYTYIGDGPSVTVNYEYKDPAGVNATTLTDNVRSTEYFNMAGQKVGNPTKGVYVKRTVTTNGTVNANKVAVK